MCGHAVTVFAPLFPSRNHADEHTLGCGLCRGKRAPEADVHRSLDDARPPTNTPSPPSTDSATRVVTATMLVI